MPKKFSVVSRFIQYEDYNHLPDQYKQLTDHALAAAKNAYAPYSKFRVGAALVDSNENLYSGNNQENVAYPSGMCAERVALFSAFAQNPDIVIDSIAIVALGAKGKVSAPPCGSCRQTILEYEVRQNTPIKVILRYDKGIYLVANSIEDLLPLSFTNKYLGT